MLLRSKNRIDYKVFNEDGTKLIKPESTESNTETMSDLQSTLNSIILIQEEIKDFIIESAIDKSTPSEEIDDNISKIASMRSTLRHLFIKVPNESIDKSLFESYDLATTSIQKYITDAKQTKRDQREFVENSSKEAKTKSLEFVIKNVEHSLKLVESQLSIKIKEATDSVIQAASKDVSDIVKSMDKIAIDLKNLIRDTTGTTKEASVTLLQKKYELLSTSLRTHSSDIKKELVDREIDKLSTFKDSILKIKLSKFSGFDSKLDIYSFQTEFEKLHKRHTPKCYMPDLLRNNYLEDPALSIVKAETDIDEIWKRLKSSFGNTNILLNNKLQELSNLDNVWKLKNPSKIAEALTKVISLMKDLMSLCEQHKIEAKLYNSDGIQRLYKLIGDSRTTRWLESICDQDIEGKELWSQLITFLERDLKVQQQKQLISSSDNDRPPRGQHSHPSFHEPPNSDLKCAICGSSDHPTTIGPKGNKLIQYFVCKEFADMSPSERFTTLKRKKLCHQCLFPGAHVDTGKHQEGKCQRQFTCRHKDHDNYTVKKHVLVCDEHKRDQENINQLERFKQRCISKRNNMPDFSKNISNYISISSFQARSPNDPVEESAIFQFQEITINRKSYLIFYDSGCDDFIVRTKSIKSLGTSAELQCKIPVNLGGVGGVTTPLQTNVYSVKIPTFDGSNAILTGISLDKITATFPTYHLNGQVEHDIHEAYKKVGGDPSQLPKLPPTIGGDVDFMIGIRYLRYFPKFVFQMPSGLTIYESIFQNSYGNRGVIGGPHEVFTMINNEFERSGGKSDFISKQFRLFQSGYHINPDVPLLCTARSYQVFNNFYPGQQSTFEIAESAGSEVSYRCTKCRSCIDCKSNGSIEATSIREEVEQELINKSVIVKPDEHKTIATLPFIQDPITRLVPNHSKALKVYKQQVSKLNRHPEDKSDVLESERKLQRLGHVEYVKNLSKDQQDQLASNVIQNYIPWRAVWKLSSLTTPCRVVFDASQPTSSGYSLNSILAKGTNGMNKLVEILIRWYTHKSAFHTDVTKMYNSIKLHPDHWCYQRYLWQDTLDVNQHPEEKVIKTLIYGVRSSGNQSERGIRQTSALSKDQYPEVDRIVNEDLYVDDCMSGEVDDQTSKRRADEMEIALSRGGFGLKGFTFSGDDPPTSLTKDGESIGVGGLIWYPKSDQISIDVSELNFAKKHRGKKPTIQVGVIPSKLTRRHCVSKVGEIFDITGKLTPITASFKLDLRNLVELGLSWDDAIPDNLRPIWEDNFAMMQEIKTIRYARTIVPSDAVNLDINTVDFGDASKQLAAVAIYARMLRKNGEYSSQLIFSRSKVISPTTQPRAELIAAVLNTHTGEVVKRALKSKYNGSIKLTDSTINLHWISNDEITLKPFVRNRIIEIKRFTSSEDWYYINTKQMLADIPTRRGSKLCDINNSSRWINGDSWMSTDVKDFPIKKVSQIILNSSDLTQMKKEATFEGNQHQAFITKTSGHSPLPAEVGERYSFSNYLIDPNRFRFTKVVRILALVFKYLQKSRYLALLRRNSNTNDQQPIFKDDLDVHIKSAEAYFWHKATNEVKRFVSPDKYKRISTEVDGVLIYTGRILPNESINIVTPMTRIMKDLHQTVFCVPILDKHSPLAYAILQEVHWFNKTVKHSGIESTLRYASKVAHIIEGREVTKRIKRACKLCRYLEKQRIKVPMGKIPNSCMTIAPAFYNTQCDLAGPFQAYSSFNKRKTIKIWLTIFCCSTTSTISIKTMDDYSTPSFLLSLTRFACDNGYPMNLYVDQGSQIVKGCEDSRISFKDLKNHLHIDVKMNFEVCPVGGHNYNGKVERKIREVKSSINKSFQGRRLSILQWETLSSEVANSMNDLPLALNGIVSDYESMDLITPNRLKLGRNNDRSPIEPLIVSKNPSKILQTNTEIFNAWFDNWLINHIPKIAHQPKWFQNDRDIMIGDVVLFLKHDSPINSAYQYGIIRELSTGRDSKIRKVKVAYKNHNENVFRETNRAVRELIVIHQVDEVDMVDGLNELFEMSK